MIDKRLLPIVLLFVTMGLPPARARAADALPPRAVARLGSYRFYHGPSIHLAVLSPDGSRAAASSSYDNPIIVLWDAATGERLRELRVPVPGMPGEMRNWNARDKTQNRKTCNLPWNALCFVLGGQRYTVGYLDRPTNPKEARFSERDYGRFGSYFEYELTYDKPLEIDYRLWLLKGETTVKQMADPSADFIEPMRVRVK